MISESSLSDRGYDFQDTKKPDHSMPMIAVTLLLGAIRHDSESVMPSLLSASKSGRNSF